MAGRRRWARGRAIATAGQVRLEIELHDRPDPVQAGDQAKTADHSRRLARLILPGRLLVTPGERARHVQPEGGRSFGHAEHAQGDAHLYAPAPRDDRDGGFPGRVPIARVVGVVEVHPVDLLAGSVDAEVVGGAAIECGVEIDPNQIRVDVAIARAGERGGRQRIVALDGDVQRVVVPEDPEPGRRRRWASIIGFRLEEVVADLRRPPGRLVRAPVDADLAGPARRPHGTRRRWAGGPGILGVGCSGSQRQRHHAARPPHGASRRDRSAWAAPRDRDAGRHQ